MKRWNLALVPALALVAWAATAQVSPTVVVSLLLDSSNDMDVVHNILEEALPGANQSFQHGPLSGEIRKSERNGVDHYTGQFTFGPLLKPVERIVFRYRNVTTPAMVGPGQDDLQLKFAASIRTVPDGRFVIWSEESYDFVLHVLSNLPTEVDDLFADGFVLNNFLAFPSTATASAFTPHVQVLQLRFTDGVSSQTLNISAALTPAGYSPLQVQN